MGTFNCHCKTGYTGNTTHCEIITCTVPQPPTNGLISPISQGSFMFNISLSISCLTGYQLNGGHSVACQANGKPSATSGITCDDIDECASSAHNCDSSATCTNTVGSFTCTCNAGFYGNGTSCQGCTYTELNIVGVNRTTGQVTCETGYTRVEGNSVATCPKNSTTGNWEGVGSCRALCSTPMIVNGVANGSAVVVANSAADFYSSVVYTCNGGYSLSSDRATIQCSVVNDNPEFTLPPRCDDIDECASSAHNCDSSATCTNTVGSFTCACNAGFYGNGTSCQGCTYTELNIVGVNRTTGQVTCATGYTRVEGNSIATCLKNSTTGNWEGVGSCRALCSEPAAITNGVVNGTQVAVSDSSANLYSSAVYNCNQGYRLSTGTSNTLVNCSVSSDVADFGSIPACQACTVDGSGHNIASVSASGTVTCNDGYYYNGSLPVCQDAFVSWQNIGSCQACKIPEGQFIDSILTTGVVTCVTGYENIPGQTAQTCTNTGGLWQNAPTCTIKVCQTTTPANGSVSPPPPTINFNQSVIYSCNTGFRLVGEPSSRCDDSGSLTAAAPVCQDIHECNNETLHDCHRDARCNNSVGSYTCSCLTGYAGNGTYCENIDECSSDLHNCHQDAICTDTMGTFNCHCKTGYTGNTTHCEIITCTVPQPPTNGLITPVSQGSFTFNISLSIFCLTGYQLNGGHSVVCQANGKPSATSGITCDDIDECSPSGVNDCASSATCTNTVGSFTCSCNAGFYGNGTSCQGCTYTELNIAGVHRTTGQVTCTTGYTRVEGNSVAACPKNSTTGNWEGVGSCRALCSTPVIADGVANGSVIVVANSATDFYSSIVYTCNGGYSLSSDRATIQCSVVNDNPEFTSPPTCDDINECASSAHNCDSSATCTNTVGSFTCACNAGFYGNGTSCQGCTYTELNIAGVNRTTGQVTCTTGYTRVEGNSVATCPKNSTTGNWEGVGSCRALCNTPMIADGVADGSAVVVANSAADFYSSVVYTCHGGYSLSSNRTTIQCSVVNDNPEFTLPPTCDDINECISSTDDCDSSATCTNTAGSFTCACNAGFYGNGTSCQGCTYTELNIVGVNRTTGQVTCATGYTRVEGNSVATCLKNSTTGNWEGVGSCRALCSTPVIVNGVANGSVVVVANSTADFYSSVVYTCNGGYSLSSDRATIQCSVVNDNPEFTLPPRCDDINECASSAHNCDSSATCTNTVGSFTCACNAGFYGNGTSCRGCTFPELNIASVDRTTGQVTCATGYTRVEGNSVATCPKNSTTGNWEGVGNCRALCSEPAAITNGVVNGTRVAVSGSSANLYSSAVYNCDQGYRLSTGTSNTLVNCSVSSDVADFGSIPACQACTVDGSGHNIASVSASGTVTCNDGYYYNGSLPVCQDAFVSWQNIGSCQACKIPEGQFIDSILTTGVVTCVPGYENIPGQTAQTCTNTGGLWQNAPTCTIKVCQITAPANGSVSPLPPTINFDQNVTYSCNTGYRLVGEPSSLCDDSGSLTAAAPVCQDIVECDNATLHDCHHDAMCTNTQGSFGCSCKSGYTGNGTYCTNINECVSGHECDTNANCTDMIGTYRCDCVVGYNGTGFSCTIVTCQRPTPPRNGTVSLGIFTYNQRLNFSCDTGYTLEGADHVLCEHSGQPTNYTTTTCADNDECTLRTHACSANAACSNNDGSYACACNLGYTGNGTNCQDIDECSSNPCQNGVCNNLVDLYQCTCDPGYTGSECQTDIDECANSLCQNGATCQDGINQYTCTCLPGYTSTFCQTDINECSSSPCLNGATCMDQVNGYNCTCPTGFQGITCDMNINDCAPNPCVNGGACSDGIADFTCACQPGYTGSTCSVDIDECANNPCQNAATCTQGVALYTCACLPGYTGINCETDVDECSSSPCQNGGACIDNVNSYSCNCTRNYEGANCQNLRSCPALHRRATDNVNCIPCSCDASGTTSCSQTAGTCTCKSNVQGDNCNQCASGYYTAKLNDFSTCTSCPCQAGRTLGMCNSTSGECSCTAAYSGLTCSSCNRGYYADNGDCSLCSCDSSGSLSDTCDRATGQCSCKRLSTGRQCDSCQSGSFLPSSTTTCFNINSVQRCQGCECSQHGSSGTACSPSGQCTCKTGYTGSRCDQCTSSSQYYSEASGCVELPANLYSSSGPELGLQVSLSQPFYFGASYEQYTNVTVSPSGFLSFRQFAGQVNLPRHVTDASTVVAPFWTSEGADLSCGASVSVTRADAATVQAINSDINSIQKPTQTFAATEALIVTWNGIRQSSNYKQLNTFQAVIASDACQSFAIFNYPVGGIQWSGELSPAVIGAGGQFHPLSGLSSSNDIDNVTSRYISRLTPGCSASLLNQVTCRATPTFSSLTVNPDVYPVCPELHRSIRLQDAFSTYTSVTSQTCYRSTPLPALGIGSIATVCCYDGDFLLSGSTGRAYVQLSDMDETYLLACLRTNSQYFLSYFYSLRPSPYSTYSTGDPVLAATSFGDPHVTTMRNFSYEFHVTGEFVLSSTNVTLLGNSNMEFRVSARYEVNPPNPFGATSATRLAFELGQNLTYEMHLGSAGNIIITQNGTDITRNVTNGSVRFLMLRRANVVSVSAGRITATVNVQSGIALSVEMQVYQNQIPRISGLLNIENDLSSTANRTVVFTTAYSLYHLQQVDSPFTYGPGASYATFNPHAGIPSPVFIADLLTQNPPAFCNGNVQCALDFAATGQEGFGEATLDFKNAFDATSLIISAVPPAIILNTTFFVGVFGQNSSLGVKVNSTNSIVNLSIHTMTGFGTPSDLSWVANGTNELALRWLPSVRVRSSTLSIIATDSAGQSSLLQVPIALCGCQGSCGSPPQTPVSQFTQLPCIACDPGFTGDQCLSDIDACTTTPCAALRNCTDLVAPSSGRQCSACPSGYTTPSSVDDACVNINECTTRSPCNSTINTCQDTVGSYMCPCKSGYTGSGDNNCRDVDECLAGSHNCDVMNNAVCANNVGSFTCSCEAGYTGAGVAGAPCQDFNQCLLGGHNCHSSATCTENPSTANSFNCTCPDGQLQTSAGNCIVLAELQTVTMPMIVPNAASVSFICSFTGVVTGGIVWTSPSGNRIATAAAGSAFSSTTTLLTSGTTEGTLMFTSSFAIASNGERIVPDGNYICTATNDRGSTSGQVVLSVDRDECTEGTADCAVAATCNNTLGSFVCTCPLGYNGNGRGPSGCANVDECTTGVHKCTASNAVCSDTMGSYTCACAIGFTGDGISSCANIDECSLSVSPCTSPFSTCSDTSGSYQCSCVAGYTGGGTSASPCQDVDECLQTGVCVGIINSVCINTVGSYQCVCGAGFKLNGDRTGCVDVDECQSGVHNCTSVETCTNAPAGKGFTCACKTGYTGSPCSDIDECSSTASPCHMAEMCQNTDGSFTCQCSSGTQTSLPTCNIPDKLQPATISTTASRRIDILIPGVAANSINGDNSLSLYQISIQRTQYLGINVTEAAELRTLVLQPNQWLNPVMFRIGGLFPASQYIITVSARNNRGLSLPSNGVTSTTLEEAPLAPTAPTVTVNSATQLRVTIAALTANRQLGVIQQYSIEYSTVEQSQELVTPVVTSINVTGSGDHVVSGLTAATKYQIRVRAFNTLAGLFSTSDSATTSNAAPGQLAAPSLLSVVSTNASISILPLALSLRNGRITEYRVSILRTSVSTYTVSESPTTQTVVATSQNSAVVATLTSLTPASEYSITVSAQNGMSGASSPALTIKTATSKPGKLPRPAGTATATTASITILPLTNTMQNGRITHYRLSVRRTQLSGVPVSETAAVHSIPVTAAQVSHQYSLSSLSAGSVYSIAVQAVNAHPVAGDFSEVLTLSTLDSVPASDFSSLGLVAGVNNIVLTIAQPLLVLRNGKIGGFSITYQQIVPRTDAPPQTESASLLSGDSVVATISNLEEHSVFTFTVSSCLESAASVCSTGTSRNITTNSKAADRAPDVMFSSLSDNITFISTLNVTFNGNSIPILELNSLVTAYEAILTQSGETSSILLNATVPGHAIGEAAPDASVLFTNLKPNTQYSVQSRVYSSSSLNSTYQHQSQLSPVFQTTTATTRPEAAFSGTPTVSDLTPTSFTVCFSPPLQALQHGTVTSYLVFYTLERVQNVRQSATPVMLRIASSSTRQNCASSSLALEPSSTYSVAIQACSVDGCSDQMQAPMFTTLTDEPSASGRVTLETTTSTTATLTVELPGLLDSNGPITHYRFSVPRTLVNAAPSPSPDPINNVTRQVSPASQFAQFTFDGLEEGAIYAGFMAACTSSANGTPQCSVETAVVLFSTLESAPATSASAVKATVVSSTSISLTVSPPALLNRNGLITAYRVAFSSPLSPIARSRTFSVPITDNHEDARALVISGLRKFQLYTFAVTTCTQIGCSVVTTNTNATTLEDAPTGIVQNVVIANGTVTQSSAVLRVSFEALPEVDRNSIIRGYVLRVQDAQVTLATANRSVSSSRESVSTTVGGPELESFTGYVLTITAYNGLGQEGPEFRALIFTGESVPEAVEQLNFSSVAPTASNITWARPSNYHGIPVGTTLVLTNTLVSNKSNVTFNLAVNTFSHVLDSLDEFVRYWVEVYSSTLTGPGTNSNVSFVTCQSVPIGNPVFSVQGISSRNFEAVWSPMAVTERNGIITHYVFTLMRFTSAGHFANMRSVTYQRNKDSLNGTIGQDPLTGCTHRVGVPEETSADSYSQIFDNLHPNTTYSLSVSSCTLIGCSNVSSAINIFTIEEAPGAGVLGVVLEIQHDSVRLSWHAPNETFHHGIIQAYHIIVWSSDSRNLTSFLQDFNVTSSTFTTVVRGLEAYYNYSYSIVAANAAGRGPSVNGSFRSAVTNPLSVSNTVATLVSGQPAHVTVSWTSPSVLNGIITQYQVLRKATKRVSVNGRLVILNDTLYDSLPVNEAAGTELNRPFSLVLRKLTGSTSYTFEVIAYIGGLPSNNNTVISFNSPVQAAPTVQLPIGTAMLPTVPPNVFVSVAPNYDSTRHILVTIPADDETHGKIEYYMIEVAVACGGKYSNAAAVPYTEYSKCRTCPCPPYIALYGPRFNISSSTGGTTSIAQLGSETNPQSCSVVCNPPLPSGSQFRILVSAVTSGPSPNALSADIATLRLAFSTNVVAGSFGTTTPAESSSGTVIAVVVVLILLLGAAAIFGFVYHRKLQTKSMNIEELHKNSMSNLKKYTTPKSDALINEIVRTSSMSKSDAVTSPIGDRTQPNTAYDTSSFKSPSPSRVQVSSEPRQDSLSTKPSLPVEDTTMSKPIEVSNMQGETRVRSANDDLIFAEEFDFIKTVGTSQLATVSRHEVNKPKNRYTNILAYDHSRVVLPPRTGLSDYINANFIHGYRKRNVYIACQGPLPQTAADFWCMIWDNNVPVIAMVTQLLERSRVKCHKYWPEELHQPFEHGELTVTLLSEDTSNTDWHVRKILVSDGQTEKTVHHLAFQSWPDHGVPATSDVLIRFVFTVRQYVPANSDAPMTVHCSAGVGRTGTFICVDTLLQRLVYRPTIDVYGTICAMRMQRNLMVQTEAQYIFLYKAMTSVAELYLNAKKSSPNATGADIINNIRSNMLGPGVLQAAI
ncbi:uncharacterized protein LOC135809326 [Sycon ciliatum]|uniref:uncharacterized protein LOC135809326 n=1 Tax=Sycon ciliatum TaxID=27933 RepID=UPI0031F6CBC6